MPAFGVLTGGGEAWRSGGVGDRGGRRWSKMEAMPPSTNHSDEDVIGFLGLWIGGWLAIGWRGGSREGEFDRRPCGGGELVAGALELPRSQSWAGRRLRGRGWWCGAWRWPRGLFIGSGGGGRRGAGCGGG